MSDTNTVDPAWVSVRAQLRRSQPAFYELETEGPLLMDLGGDGWLLEITPDGRLLCQMGMAIDDIKTLMSEGTPEELGTDEVGQNRVRAFQRPETGRERDENGFHREA